MFVSTPLSVVIFHFPDSLPDPWRRSRLLDSGNTAKIRHRSGFHCSPFLDLVCNPDHSLKDFLPTVLCPATRVTSSTRNILILQATLLMIAKSGFLLPHVDMRSNSLHRKNIIGGLSVRNFRNYSSRAFSPR